MTASALYEGTLRHRRFAPVEHRLRAPLSMLYLDLDELPELFDRIPLWSARRSAPGRFDRRDHHGPADEPLAESTRRLVRERTGRTPTGPICLLTIPRTFGHGFNPVSFYYCFDGSGQRVETVVAEVSNTPWGERHLYVLGPSRERGSTPRAQRYRHAKAFHVSPFLGMGLEYDWRFTPPGERLLVHVETREVVEGDRVRSGSGSRSSSGSRPFDATLVLRRRELTRAALAGMLLRRPAQALTVLGRIYWHAGLLWLKRTPYHAHPGPAAERGGGVHPNPEEEVSP